MKSKKLKFSRQPYHLIYTASLVNFPYDKLQLMKPLEKTDKLQLARINTDLFHFFRVQMSIFLTPFTVFIVSSPNSLKKDEYYISQCNIWVVSKHKNTKLTRIPSKNS